MVGLWCLLVLQLPARAQAAPSCIGLFSSWTTETPASVLTSEYDRAQILAIGVNDHVFFQPFDHLATLIRERGLDPRLKMIVIEDSSLRASLYELLSVKAISFDEFKKLATKDYGMFSMHEEALFTRVLPVVREMNARRPHDPLLVTAIDSMTNARALEIFSKPADEQFGVSIERERETARTFEKHVVERFPGRKVVVAYQATHIAKNLRATGRDGSQTKRAFLGWLSMATHALKIASHSVRVVLVDSIGGWSKTGVLNLPEGVERPRESESAIAIRYNGVGKGISAFQPGTFIRDYRNGSVDVINPSQAVFDAVIVEP